MANLRIKPKNPRLSDIESFTVAHHCIDPVHEGDKRYTVIKLTRWLNIFGDEITTEKQAIAVFQNFYMAQDEVKRQNKKLHARRR